MNGWTVHLTRPGSDTVITRTMPHVGMRLLEPHAHRGVSWFTTAVFVLVSMDPETRTVTACYSHREKDHLDKPRNPARLPK